MKLLCWNVRDTNTDSDNLRRCLGEHRPDVVCLQEVDPIHFEVLQDNFPFAAKARDSVSAGHESHLVIAAQQELVDVEVVAHPVRVPRPSPVARMHRLDQFLETLSVSVLDDAGRPLRLLTLHTTSFSGPSQRAEEVTAAMAVIDDRGPCVIAGDFNSLAHPALSWAIALPLGFRLSEVFKRERRDLNARMAGKGFQPAICGVTFPLTAMRLDQVFVRDVGVKSAHAHPKRWGSDHRPLLVELA